MDRRAFLSTAALPALFYGVLLWTIHVALEPYMALHHGEEVIGSRTTWKGEPAGGRVPHGGRVVRNYPRP